MINFIESQKENNAQEINQNNTMGYPNLARTNNSQILFMAADNYQEINVNNLKKIDNIDHTNIVHDTCDKNNTKDTSSVTFVLSDLVMFTQLLAKFLYHSKSIIDLSSSLLKTSFIVYKLIYDTRLDDMSYSNDHSEEFVGFTGVADHGH